MHNLQIQGMDVWCVSDNTGLRELTNDIHDGILRIGGKDNVIIFVGRADTLRGRHFPAVAKRLISACSRFGRNTHFVFAGPFPQLGDEIRMIG